MVQCSEDDTGDGRCAAVVLFIPGWLQLNYGGEDEGKTDNMD